MDYGLPRISGAELAERLKRIRPVAILMLSGNAELMGTPKFVDSLLAKPQRPEELLKAIALLLSRSGS